MKHSDLEKREILLVDKPVGITSYDVIRKLKKEYNDPNLKIGHAGTLDPRASGLMIVGVGEGTKKLKEYVELPKEYIAEILLGESRTTSDMEGEILEEVDVPPIEKNKIVEVLESLVGVLRLPVSPFSAVKKGGQPLYKKAHIGQDVGTLPLRDMQVHEAELLRHSCSDGTCVSTVRFYVESGVYIRSLAEEFGRCLGYPSVLKSLRRVRIGELRVEDARKLSPEA